MEIKRTGRVRTLGELSALVRKLEDADIHEDTVLNPESTWVRPEGSLPGKKLGEILGLPKSAPEGILIWVIQDDSETELPPHRFEGKGRSCELCALGRKHRIHVNVENVSVKTIGPHPFEMSPILGQCEVCGQPEDDSIHEASDDESENHPFQGARLDACRQCGFPASDLIHELRSGVDVRHKFHGDPDGICLRCGESSGYWIHEEAESTEEGPHEFEPVLGPVGELGDFCKRCGFLEDHDIHEESHVFRPANSGACEVCGESRKDGKHE